MSSVHIPVLAGELIDLTAPAPGDTAVDCTFGAGGHARLVADRIGPTGTLICIDRDPTAEARYEELASDVACETRFLRMDPGQELDARAVVNDWDERQLAQVFRRLGEEPNARRIAREIVRRRKKTPFATTGELVEAIEAALPAAVRRNFGGGHPAKRVFQAVRIAGNGELDPPDPALPLAWSLLREGGRLAAIAFHSLEDRRVKRFLAARARGCICPPDFPVCVCGRDPEAELLTGRAVAPTPGEVASNPRAKSGRLRAARKLGPGEDA